ncbi:phenylalanine ammonia-lyase [Aspergillus steynii IBT 23096]|uniref:Phenylalanine ammonia-lyase n=1 Tax=Aspergillus steynii IBT 23096 TaxID=1392250 RepID=A0A2I2GCP7_9EURO|nr:phenylalanine ammonia-lyase [Aspergillus steynii IBT 23096]PLB50653.1 phenylalanine ammonia-lyase [Aspergillus steynii IBT 23096]
MFSYNQFQSHLDVARARWEKVQTDTQVGNVTIDGNSLTIADVVAVAKSGCRPHLTKDPERIESINRSITVLTDCLAKGHAIYGVNTGFGGSADSRTTQVYSLQRSLLQFLQSGILTEGDIGDEGSALESHSMPPEWVKATMLVRCNSVARGHSAVSVASINAILRLIRHRIVPVVPLRGTISASGDLMPLAYIVGAAEGSPGIHVQVGKRHERRIVTAQQALKAHQIPGISLGPKEALGLVNGTAAAAGLASLAMYEAHQLAILSQVVTALTVEALSGSKDSFHPFINLTRPHEGQMEAATNILAVLQGSHLAKGGDAWQSKTSGLVQDRYSIRTSAQWIGPQLEDLALADRQIDIELNSTTDNPLIDNSASKFYCGGNFQATTVTSAMEKTRLALQMLGKLLFTQCTELIDPGLSNGLPTNLAADEPSLSFTMKGVDINMAAYMSELAYLANPVSSHVQTAEMHNQAINSLAFVTARYTMKAVDLVSMIGACSLYVVCQALDLRVIQLRFYDKIDSVIHQAMTFAFNNFLSADEIEELVEKVTSAIKSAWPLTSRLDIEQRNSYVVDRSLSIVVREVAKVNSARCPKVNYLAKIDQWRELAVHNLTLAYKRGVEEFCDQPITPDYLGLGSKLVYVYIRRQLGIPFHQGFAEHLSPQQSEANTIGGREKKSIGAWISIIYEALREDKMTGILLGALLARVED